MYTSATRILPPSLHDALPISKSVVISNTTARCLAGKLSARVGRTTSTSTGIALKSARWLSMTTASASAFCPPRSEEHTSELQSQSNLVCRLLLEKKKQHQRLH